MTARRRWVVGLVIIYKYTLSPCLHALSGPGAGCRFHPTCSEYAAQALEQHGLVHGGLLALRRVLRCHPFSQGGFDPVPETTLRGHLT